MAEIGKSIRGNSFALSLGSLSLILIFLLVLLFTGSSAGKKYTNVSIGEKTLVAEIADTDKKRSTGLSGRESLEEGSGILFVFDKASDHSFWMKDMKFPIDIIWINNKKVIDISHQIQPEEKDPRFLRIYKPVRDAKFVLEVNSGYARKNNIKIGDTVQGSIF